MRVVCYGLINPGEVFAVDTFPAANAGAYVREKWPFVGGDSVMVARTLAGWRSAAVDIIGNALGDDIAGRSALSGLAREGVRARVALRPELRTPWEIDVVDRAGTRTFFVENSPCWATAAEADLSAIPGADIVYADWYADAGAQRVVDAAQAARVPVYLNVEIDQADPTRNHALLAGAAWAQLSLGAEEQAPLEAAERLAREAHALGPRLCVVTRGRNGALAFDGARVVVAPALDVTAVDGQGAGATFSAAMLHALLRGWSLETALAFAARAGSLKVARRGLLPGPPSI